MMKLLFITLFTLTASFSLAKAQSGKSKNAWHIKSNYGTLMPDSSWVYYGNVSYISKTDTITADSAFADKNISHYTFKGNVVMKTYHMVEGSTAVLRTDKLEYTRQRDE